MRVPHQKIKQTGATLILMMFIIALAATIYLLKAYDSDRIRIEQEKKTMRALNEAKQALLAWAVAHGDHPGQLPYPDRREVVSPNYDGRSDCPPSGTAFNLPNSYALFLGQLPIAGQDDPCENPLRGLGEDFRDALGNRLWYAVSRNVVHRYEFLLANPNSNPIINPNILSNSNYPWLRVLDRNGTLISDRVAAVILASGNALTGQNRAGVAPNANQYLDAFNIGATNYSNANYVVPDENFIIGQDSRGVSEADTTVTKPYHFNDKLVFITIDELMAAVTHRASGEASKLLNQYRAKNGQFPYAANLGTTLNNHNSSGVNTKGMMPIDVTDTCGCTDEFTCNCSFAPISNVAMHRVSGTWNSAQDVGSCTSVGKVCTCTGMGSCSRFSTYFTCNLTGECKHNLDPVLPPNTDKNEFVYSVPNYADVSLANAGCQLSDEQAVCSNTGTFSIGLKEPAWFKKNLWQDYFYYEWSPSSALEVGTRTGVGALLISTGDTLIATEAQPFIVQSRPSSDISNYLDSAQNINNDLIFDATNKQKTNNYNDQTYIVTP